MWPLLKFGRIIPSLIVTLNLFVGESLDAAEFQEVVLDPAIGKVCYAVTLADVDGDGLDDVVAVTENQVLWYQNPTWQKRIIIADQTPADNVCIAPHDIDGDGKVDFALGAGWTRNGAVHWLSRSQSLDDPWKVHFIAEAPWAHRMRFADVLGTGKPQLVVSPLNATRGNGVLLTALEIPDDPQAQRWSATVLDDTLNRMHNHWHVAFQQDDQIDTLTASREGVHLIHRDGDQWKRTKLGEGATSNDPNLSGAGEIKMGRLRNGTRFITTVEPMHGTMLAIYVADETNTEDGSQSWRRHVIADGFQRGHALWCADLDGDGGDEIVFGHSDTPERFGVVVFRQTDESGTQWNPHVVDAGGMATEDIAVGDLNGDGRPDIVAGGRSTGNLKLYVNLLPSR